MRTLHPIVRRVAAAVFKNGNRVGKPKDVDGDPRHDGMPKLRDGVGRPICIRNPRERKCDAVEQEVHEGEAERYAEGNRPLFCAGVHSVEVRHSDLL
jgi:hypothetical protein